MTKHVWFGYGIQLGAVRHLQKITAGLHRYTPAKLNRAASRRGHRLDARKIDVPALVHDRRGENVALAIGGDIVDGIAGAAFEQCAGRVRMRLRAERLQ